MKNFRVKVITVTKSQCGSYVYKADKVVEAENEEAVRAYVKEKAPSWYGFKRCWVTIKSVTEV